MPEETTTQTTEPGASLESFNETNPDAGKDPKATDAAADAGKDAGKDPKPAADTTGKADELTLESYAPLDDVKAEGVEIDQDLMSSFKTLAKDNKLSVETAKKIVELQINSIKKQNEEIKAMRAEWEAMNQKTYGDNLKNVETNCSRVLAELDKSGKFKELLALVGAEKHPATLGFLKTIGDSLLEKAAVNPNATVAPTKEVDLEDFN